MKTARQKVIDCITSGDTVNAMRIAAKWGDLGEQRDAIKSGWNSRTNPDFYRQIGKNPDQLWSKGVEALKIRIGIAS
jgi:hypothetical protein